MKRAFCVSVLVALIFVLCGCSLFSQGSYFSVEPHQESGNASLKGIQEVSDYGQLRSALAQLVENGTQSGIIYFSDLTEETVGEYMESAISYILQNHPIGTYAVEEIRYDVGSNIGKRAVAVNVSYSRNRAEILRIKRVTTPEQAMERVITALENCDAGVVFRIGEMDSIDFAQKIRDHVEANPDKCMELPQVSVTYFPEKGPDRVVELYFTYQTSREALRSMQTRVESMFSSAELYVGSEASDREKLSLLYTFLMERYDYTLETSITPSYSLLCHGVGDSKAFAAVYAAMCRRTGIQCQMISGTKDGVPYYWNVIPEGDIYYHVDLLRCSQEGELSLKTASEMSGYVWDFAIYPLEDPQQESTEPTITEQTDGY